MSVREWVNKNPTAITIGTIVLLIVALGVVFLQLRPGGPSERDAYWYELSTGTWFRASVQQMPPIAGPNGSEAVRAHLFSCGACTSDQWFGYLETMSEEYVRAEADSRLNQMIGPERMAFYNNSQLVRATDGDAWVRRESSGGDRIMSAARDRCEDYRDFKRCTP